MGAYVTRKDPSTGKDRKYYKSDDGKLYNDYNSAAAANMNPIARASRAVQEKIGDIQNRGAIPVPSFNNKGYAALGYIKSLAGQAGRPFAIQSNPETDRFLQRTIDASTKGDGTVTFNQNIKDKGEYDAIGKDLGNKAFGRYTGKVDGQGNVTVQDDYDTNRDVEWHLARTIKGVDAQGNKLGAGDRLISAASALHRGLNDVGLTNSRPYGESVVIGNVNGSSKPKPESRKAGQADITVASTAELTPTMSYAVKAGDTLSAIAAANDITVADIIAKNKIANADLINVGQRLMF